MLKCLEFLAVERSQRERGYVDLVQAADVDREHVRAVRRDAARIGADAAALAEQVMDYLLGELVVGLRVLAVEQRELRRRNEGPERTALRADRAVALRRPLERGLDAIADTAAMTAAFVGFHVSHDGPG